MQMLQDREKVFLKKQKTPLKARFMGVIKITNSIKRASAIFLV
jgi:hypothetical protein